MKSGGIVNILHVITATIGVAIFIMGYLMALPEERTAGRALIIGGAIIIVGALIASAISGAKR